MNCPYCKIQIEDLNSHINICMAEEYEYNKKVKDKYCVDNPNNDESHICVKCARIPLI